MVWFICLLWLAASARGQAEGPQPSTSEPVAVVHTIDGRTLTGSVNIRDDGGKGQLQVRPQSSKAVLLPLVDVDSVVLRPDMRTSESDRTLIDNDGAHPARTRSASIKLRKGLHRVVIPYWQKHGNRVLKLEYSGPGLTRRAVPGSAIAHVIEDKTRPDSPGIDAQGYRLPENPPETRRRLRYRFYTGQFKDDEVDTLSSAFRRLGFEREGSAGRVGLRVATAKESFGLLFTGYIRIERDGQYTFHLTADDGAMMYLGRPPRFVGEAGVAAAGLSEKPWRIDLADRGVVEGKIERWANGEVKVRSPGARRTSDAEAANLELTIPVSEVRAIWANGIEPRQLPRTRGSADPDTAYIMPKEPDKSSDAGESTHTSNRGEGEAESESKPQRFDPAQLRRVSGRAEGFENDHLRFEYEGEIRRVSLDRLAGLVLGKRDQADEGGQASFHQRLVLLTGQRIPGRWRGLDEALDEAQVRFETSWGQTVHVPARTVKQIQMVNGRLVPLTALSPDKVETTAYFDRIPPHRVIEPQSGRSVQVLPGKPDMSATQSEEQAEKESLAAEAPLPAFNSAIQVHSQTRLEYRLEEPFVRFMATVGLKHPEGQLGDVAIKVLADDQTLFERESVTADDGPIKINIPITDVDRLRLETNFGQGQHVGDRVVWGRPRLIRK